MSDPDTEELFAELTKLHRFVGYAIYAYAPNGPITLEVIRGGDVQAFTGPSLIAALRKGLGLPDPPDIFD